MRYISAARLAVYRLGLQHMVGEFGLDEVSRMLYVPAPTLQRWLDGSEAMPHSAVLRAIDEIIDRKLPRDLNGNSTTTAAVIETSQIIRAEAREAVIRARQTVLRAQKVKSLVQAARAARPRR